MPNQKVFVQNSEMMTNTAGLVAEAEQQPRCGNVSFATAAEWKTKRKHSANMIEKRLSREQADGQT